MPFSAALSTHQDTARALDEVCLQALGALPYRPHLAMIFFSPHHADELQRRGDELHQRIGAACLLGCGGESIVGNDQEIEQGPALSLWLARWAGLVRMQPFHVVAEPTPSGPAFRGLPEKVAPDDAGQSAMLLLGDPFSFPADPFLQLVGGRFPELRVMGGMASGGPGPGSSRLLLGGTMHRHGAVGVLLSGVSAVGVVSPGCRRIGNPLVVTRAQGNIVLELDGKLPLARLHQLWNNLDPRDRELFQRELYIGLLVNATPGEEGGDRLVRTKLGLEQGRGTLVLGDRVGVGQRVQFLVRDADAADQELHRLLRGYLGGPGPKPSGALLFTCVRRGSRLFPGPHHDAAALRAEAGNIPVAGFFAQGEIGPVGDQSLLHADAASVALFGE